MNKKDILDAIKLVKENSPKRKFTQTVDFIVTLKGLDLKKPDQQVDFFTNLHFPVRKKSVCALVGPELQESAQKVCDEVILVDDFPKYQKDKKLTKKLSETHDFFIAQATIMPKVAATFGRVFGPRSKMPNPKAGCVVPPNANLEQLYKRLQTIVNIKAKSFLMIQTVVGSEDMEADNISENVLAVFDQIIHHLPQEKNNVKRIILKLTMGKPVIIGGDTVAEPEPKRKKSGSVKNAGGDSASKKQVENPEEKKDSAGSPGSDEGSPERPQAGEE